jgi:hypothetical protein
MNIALPTMTGAVASYTAAFMIHHPGDVVRHKRVHLGWLIPFKIRSDHSPVPAAAAAASAAAADA